MNDFLIEQENSISNYHLDEISNVILKDNFPWYWNDYTTSYKYPSFVHTLLKRPEDRNEAIKNSVYLDFFLEILNSFCKNHNLNCNIIYRAAINLCYFYPNVEYQEPHIDHNFDHKVFLMYLNDFDNGDTYLFKKQQDIFLKEKTIISKKNKIVCFNGNRYHSNGFPKPGQRRIVCVITTN